MSAATVILFLIIARPGANDGHPIPFQKPMASLEECIGTVNALLLKARDTQPEGVIQAGCILDIPKTEHP